jgi:hypothetical protein
MPATVWDLGSREEVPSMATSGRPSPVYARHAFTQSSTFFSGAPPAGVDIAFITLGIWRTL